MSITKRGLIVKAKTRLDKKPKQKRLGLQHQDRTAQISCAICVRYRTGSGSDRIISNQRIPADPVATAPGSDTLRGE